MRHQQHFHVRSWDGRFWAFVYIGPLRLTIFKSSWLFGKRKKRSLGQWVLHYLGRTIIMAVLIGLPAWATYHHPYWVLDILTSLARRLH